MCDHTHLSDLTTGHCLIPGPLGLYAFLLETEVAEEQPWERQRRTPCKRECCLEGSAHSWAALRNSRGLEPLMPFSPHRSSNSHHASYLLRAVAQLRSQLRAHLPQARPAPSQRPCAWRWLGGILLGPVVWTKCPRLGLVALCEAEEAPPTYSRPYVGESRFNWKLFWQFLRPHLLVLGVAIVVSCPSPCLHVRDREGASQGFVSTTQSCMGTACLPHQISK